jgi:hypothetical protein
MAAFQILAALTTAFAMLFAQAPQTPRAQRQVGIVKSVKASARELTITLDAGGESKIVAAPEGSVVRVAPGEKDLSKAAKIEFGGIEVGDRVLAKGDLSSGQFVASSIVVISKSDLVRKQEAERAEWKRRGVSGKVSAINLDTRELTVTTARPAHGTLTVRVAANAVQRRYRPDSARFSDAQPSALTDIKIGDQIHALGDKSADGAVLTAEQIVTGTFRNFAAVISSIDPSQHVLTVRDIDAKKDVQVVIAPDSMLRKLLPEVAQRLANRRPGDANGNGNGTHAEAQQQPGSPQNGNGHGPDIQAILERMPAFTLDELKPGDAVIIASGESSTPDRIKAITILSGVEPILTQPASAQRELLGSWNLNMEPNLP